MTISLFSPNVIFPGTPLPEAAHRIAGQTLGPVLLRERQHATGAWGLEVEQEHLC